MISEIEQLMDERPKVRRVFDEIDDFFDKMLVVNYIICITFSAVVICVPTIMAFFYLPENVRIWISLIIGGILSLIEKLKRQVVELSAEIGRSLLGESRFTPDILSTSIDNTNDLLHKKETELEDIKYKLANQQNAMGKLDFYYSQFRTWADEFDNSTMEQKKMIAYQLIKEVKVARGYELEIVFDLNYEQFISK